jgi:hypothetical protein
MPTEDEQYYLAVSIELKGATFPGGLSCEVGPFDTKNECDSWKIYFLESCLKEHIATLETKIIEPGESHMRDGEQLLPPHSYAQVVAAMIDSYTRVIGNELQLCLLNPVMRVVTADVSHSSR